MSLFLLLMSAAFPVILPLTKVRAERNVRLCVNPVNPVKPVRQFPSGNVSRNFFPVRNKNLPLIGYQKE